MLTYSHDQPEFVLGKFTNLVFAFSGEISPEEALSKVSDLNLKELVCIVKDSVNSFTVLDAGKIRLLPSLKQVTEFCKSRGLSRSVFNVVCNAFSRVNVICAFPTLGKTTLAEMLEGFVDLDAHDFRQVFECTNPDDLDNSYVLMIERLLCSRNKVLINLPSVLPALTSFTNPLMVLPCYGVKEAVARSEKRGDDEEWRGLMQVHFDEWISEWKRTALECNVPMIYANSLEGAINGEYFTPDDFGNFRRL